MVNINKTIEQIKELGPKKAAGYSLLAIGILEEPIMFITGLKEAVKLKSRITYQKIKLRKSKQLLTLKSKKSSNSMPIVKKKNVCRQIRK